MSKVVPLCFAACSLAAAAWAADPVPYDWGAVIKTFEPSASGDYKGTFTRRGTSNVYDAEWIYVPTQQKIVDVLEVRGLVGGELVIYRRGNQGIYTMPITNGVMGRGKASWVSDPTYYWEAVSLPASAAAPAAPTATAPAPAKAAAGQEQWFVAKAGDGAFGYDAKSIAEKGTPGHKGVYWAVFASKPVKGSAGAWSFAMTETVFDCNSGGVANLAMVTFDLAGKPLETLVKDDPPKWKPTAAKGVEELLQGLVCEDAILDKAREVGSMDALFPGLQSIAR